MSGSMIKMININLRKAEHKLNYAKWIASEIVNDSNRKELLDIFDKETEIEERFYKDLEFGTGGIRGVIGAGSNRVNIYTIRKVSQGIANFINTDSNNKKEKSIVIAYDSRNYSEVFAIEIAKVLVANNIKAYVFESLRPTPELSFSVRFLSCEAGIVVTASHNPPEYNGLKVYGSDGGQITMEYANAITAEVEKLDIFSDVLTCDYEEAIREKMLLFVGEEIDMEYLNRVVELSVKPNMANEVTDFKIVYTPLHGSGLMLIKRALSMLGYCDVNIVESQSIPDGSFPTVKSPNPEEREALLEGIRLAYKLNADIVIGTDPDSDRVGVAVRNKEGDYVLITGNQIGALLTYYLITSKKNVNSRDAVIKTVVTSDLGRKIAESHGATVFDTLTGFKFIGEKIKKFEENKDYDFLFGYEESHGYLVGTFVRDKDAVISSVLIVEMAAYYKANGLSLLDVIEMLYQLYGYHVDVLESYTFAGISGSEKIMTLINKFRNRDKLVSELPNSRIIEDYIVQEKIDIQTSHCEHIDLPTTNLIKIHNSNGSWFAIRPSGTEPKLKIYYSAWGKSAAITNNILNQLIKDVEEFLKDGEEFEDTVDW